jgi:hypothetical protein
MPGVGAMPPTTEPGSARVLERGGTPAALRKRDRSARRGGNTGTAEQLEFYFEPRSAHVILEASWR